MIRQHIREKPNRRNKLTEVSRSLTEDFIIEV